MPGNLLIGVNELIEALVEALSQLDREGDVLFFNDKNELEKKLLAAMEYAIIDTVIVDMRIKDYKED